MSPTHYQQAIPAPSSVLQVWTAVMSLNEQWVSLCFQPPFIVLLLRPPWLCAWNMISNLYGSFSEIVFHWVCFHVTQVIIIIIIAFKGAIRDFLQSPHSAANYLQHVRSSGPGAIVCKSRATHWALITCKCHVTCHLVRRDSSAIKFDRVYIAFIWALFYWLNH